jgi:outer membrane protein TolC
LLHPRAFPVLSLVLCFLCIQPVFAENLNFETVLAEALQNSFDSKISQENIQAGRAFVRETQADYYPQLSLRFGNDFIYSFTEGDGVVAGGDVVIADESSYRHFLISSISYTLFDFGVRRLKVENARRQVSIAGLQERQAYLDARKEVLQYYSDGLKLQKQIEAAQIIFARQNTIFRLARQLQQAGTLGREQVGTAALDLAETLNQLEELKIRFQEVLTRLTFYTQRSYAGDEVMFADFTALPQRESSVELDRSPEVQIYQQQIENKQAELSMVKRAMLPKLMLYGSHRMYGSDTDDFGRSLSDLSARDATVSLIVEWPLFSGFADIAKQARLNHEISSLRYQKEKKLAELQQEASSITSTYEIYGSGEKNHLEQLWQLAEEQNDAERLAAQQITDRISFQRKLIELSRQRLDVELWRVDYATAALALDFINKARQ